MIHDNDITNQSGNRPFESILKTSMSRRHALARGAALSATGFLAALAGNKTLMRGAVAAATAPASGAAAAGGGTAIAQATSTLLGFAALPIPEATGPEASISDDYEYQVLIPWGTPLKPGVPAYDGAINRPSAKAQTDLVGIGHDGIWFFPMDGSSNERGIIAVNHEFGTNPHVLGKEIPESAEDVLLSQHAHGVTVVEVQKQGNQWQPVTSSNKNRRIHVNTPVTFSGPVAGSPLLETPAGNQPQGTVNNCANGYTPWGTYLTCEENFDGYFGSTLGAEEFEGVDEEGNGIDGITDKRTSPQQRYGFSADSSYGWFLYDPRFDLSNPQYKNAENRFGWVVEIDPMNPNQAPVKRTAMGRVKHEGVALTVGQGGRAVGYMGDDGQFEYCYKFVSRANWRSMTARGISPLDEGDLYVAKFNDDGTGEWMLLDYDANPALQNSSELSSQEEVLTFTRVAGDVVGATPMDRPEWTTVAPDGSVYWALTNNSLREEPNAPNPLAPNPHGHILVTRDSDNQVGTNFTWEIFVLAQDTHPEGGADAFTDPDGLWADPDGRLFIQTDGGQSIGNEIEPNNQMLVANTLTGEIKRMFAGPAGCEVTGITYTPDRRTMFINVQHPGDGDPIVTNFPAPFQPDGNGPIPRDATVVITKKDGGIIGS